MDIMDVRKALNALGRIHINLVKVIAQCLQWNMTENQQTIRVDFEYGRNILTLSLKKKHVSLNKIKQKHQEYFFSTFLCNFLVV